jgi:hypothetical protein
MGLVHIIYRGEWLILLAIILVFTGACTTHSVPVQPSEPPDATPTIHILNAPKQVTPASTARISCVATSGNNDTLIYKWSATGGQLEGQGEGITWIAPDATGDYTITVVVSDMRSHSAARSAKVIVTLEPNHPPIVDSMRCLDCRNGIDASRWAQYHIQCQASDPENDELSYTWWTTIGKIEGEGPLVLFRTLAEYGNTLITVKVTDSKGNETKGYLAINVSCCH